MDKKKDEIKSYIRTLKPIEKHIEDKIILDVGSGDLSPAHACVGLGAKKVIGIDTKYEQGAEYLDSPKIDKYKRDFFDLDPGFLNEHKIDLMVFICSIHNFNPSKFYEKLKELESVPKHIIQQHDVILKILKGGEKSTEDKKDQKKKEEFSYNRRGFLEKNRRKVYPWGKCFLDQFYKSLGYRNTFEKIPSKDGYLSVYQIY